MYLKLQPYRQTTVAIRRCLKLSSKYYGPFPILEKIGGAAYKLRLPEGSQIHPVFHVSQLKKRSGKQLPSPDLPLAGPDGEFRVEPVAVLDRMIINRNGTPVAQVLIRWSNFPDEESTWEDYWSLISSLGHFCKNTELAHLSLFLIFSFSFFSSISSFL